MGSAENGSLTTFEKLSNLKKKMTDKAMQQKGETRGSPTSKQPRICLRGARILSRLTEFNREVLTKVKIRNAAIRVSYGFHLSF